MAAPPSQPAKLPEWASGGGASIAEPDAATKSTGWIAAIKPPHDWVNWWWNLVYQWLLYFSRTGLVFDDLADAVDYAAANLSAGALLVVMEDDSTTGPGVELVEKASGAFADGQIDASGNLVVHCVGTLTPLGTNRDLDGAGGSGTPIATYTRTNSGTNYAIKTNGEVTVLAYDQYVEAFNATTGASLWVFDNSTAVLDLAICAGFVYVVSALTAGGGDATANRHVHKLNLSTSAVVWSYRHSAAGGTLHSVATNGRQVFIAGAASDYGSAATMRALVAADGTDAAGEGPNGTDASGLAWDRVDANPSTNAQVLDCDGVMLFAGFPAAATYQLEAIGQADGVTAWAIAHPDGTINANSVAVDQDYVLLAASDNGGNAEGYVEAYDKRRGALAWRWASTGGTPAHSACYSVVSDGCAVFCLGEGEDNLWRITRGNVPLRLRVVDPDTELVRYRNWALQPEVQ